MSCGSPLPVSSPGVEAEGLALPAWSLDSPEWCEEHEHRLSLFCLDDLEPLCKQCAAVSHEGHRVYLLNEAATDCKEELRTSVNGLKKKKIHYERATRTCEHAAKYNQAKAKLTEEQMHKEFEKLHQFLREEEEVRILALKEEQEEKKRDLKERTNRMSQVIKSLEDKIQLIEEELDTGGEGVTFLQQYQDTAKSTQTGHRELKKICRLLINVAKHLGNIQYAVWDKMKHIAPYTPVTLDPRTAGKSLSVSSELNSVHISPGPSQGHEESRSVPANPERFHPYSCILAKEGFSSGVHCWDIEVGDSSNWTVGVAAQSVSRGEEFEACPEAGLWCISLRDGKYQALTTPSQTLHLDKSHHLKRVRVRLDCDEEKLEFMNSDTDAHLFTFRHRFAEKVYPYFETISARGGLAVLAQRVNVSVGSHHVPVEDAAAKETQESESSTDGGIVTSVTNNNKKTLDNLHVAEDKIPSVCSKSEETNTKLEKPSTQQKLKTKSTRREKTSGKKQPTRKPRFSVTYHVSLNRALNIVNNESGNHQEIQTNHVDH
ncbi:E3 ubiquitin-protein ligase TRIM35-like isoform X1 [Thunnus thynnus]|uniref:E3 ubiquitin-protein ligase TRIM35-like isoform X1 n=2 Tax=Thunnus thynnus TaxID=8237 RepID=UPI003529605F